MTPPRRTPPGRTPPEPEPSLGPTRPGTLVLAAVAAGVLTWVLVSRFYGDIPALPWLPSVTLLLLAVAEGVTAQATRARIERRPGAKPVEPLLVARLVALAKASSVTGSLGVGVYAALTGYLAWQRDLLAAAGRDLPVAAAGLVAAGLLLAAALWLERSGRIPDDPDGPDGPRRVAAGG